MSNKFYYNSLEKYLKDIMKDLRMSMQIRSIMNLLFIEKVRFLKIELRTKTEIFEEILQQEYQLIKSIPAKLDAKSENIDLKLSSKFMYNVEKGPVLFYFVWSDNLGNIIKPGRPFEIVNEGDTFTLH